MLYQFEFIFSTTQVQQLHQHKGR